MQDEHDDIYEDVPKEAAAVVVWDPDLVTPEQYAELVEAIGNVVRAHGGLGVELLRPDTFGVPVDQGVFA
ncbi:MAG: hypothetical protein ACYTGL_24500 [Planctomycetota bacterium]|jgi:hypothetical protein